MMRRVAAGASAVAALLAATGLAFGGGAANAQATAPPSLMGETLLGPNPLIGSDCHQITGTQNIVGDFTATGTATGPYPGTFSETGHFTYIFPGILPAGQPNILTFHADFTINSAAGAVTGSKDLTAPQTQGLVSCNDPSDGLPAVTDFVATPLTYQATIATPSGSYTDSGSSTLNSGSAPAPGQISQGQFIETFDTSNGVVPPTPTTTPPPPTTTPPTTTPPTTTPPTTTTTLPTTTPASGPPASKQDCMNGGYAKYGYKNQGQCVAAVNAANHGG